MGYIIIVLIMELMALNGQNLISIISVIVGVTTFLLGLFVFLADRKGLINQVFFVLTLNTVLWIGTVLVAVSFGDRETVLLFRRLAFAAASFIAFFIYYFSYLFPKPNEQYKFPLLAGIILTTLIAAMNIFTDYTLKDIGLSNGVQSNVYGPGYYIFIIYFFGALFVGVANFLGKRKQMNELELVQIRLVLTGLVVSGVLAASTNLILPKLLETYSTGQLGPLTVSVFIILSTYAILRHHLFDIGVVVVELLTSTMWLFILFRLMVDNSLQGRIMDFILLVITIFFGALLIRSVNKEVKQREKVERLANDLEVANEKLESLDVARREFLSFASHQLKTPMTVIKGYATLATDPVYLNSPEKMKQIAEKIVFSTDQMYRLISNFLDVRAIEEGKMSFIFKPTDLVRLASSLVEDAKSYASKKNLKLELASVLPSIIISADETKLRQAVQNLIDNAVKYTDEGFVRVEVKDEENYALLLVTDSGKGMSTEAKEHLFEQFFRDGRTAKAQGTGLGLYIAKEIVKAHKGEIWADSLGEGKGSKFTVKLPKEHEGSN